MPNQSMTMHILNALVKAPDHGMTMAEVQEAIGITTDDDRINFTATLVRISSDNPTRRLVDWRWECQTWGGVSGYETQLAGRMTRIFYRLSPAGRQVLASA